MTLRRRYVISYDVSDDKRRTRLYQLLLAYGNHVQFSVFLADLTPQELIILRGKIRDAVNEVEDQCLLVNLGREARPLESTLEVVGRPYTPPARATIF
ncbi:MAG: CRISPR-associated endonuclease Cas2 [Gemmatimonadales bacterium]